MLDKVCEGLISGKSIVEVCKPKNMPSYNAVYLAMAKDELYAKSIARAREAQQDFIADQNVMMADKATPENVRVVQLRIWARQWRAAKLAPRKFGEKISQEVTGRDGAALIPAEPEITDEMRARALEVFIKRTQMRRNEKFADLPTHIVSTDRLQTTDSAATPAQDRILF